MHVIIGGCGRVGAEVAQRLSDGPHDVVVIDKSRERLDALGSGFNGERQPGNVTDEAVLLDAGIDRADALVAVTSSDNANLMAVEIANALYGVKHTVARLYNPEREESYRRMGVHYVLGTRMTAKTIMNEIHSGAFPLHVAFEEGDIEVVEVVVTEEGHGLSVDDLEASGHVRVGVVRRGGRSRLPRPNDTLAKGDLLVVAARRGAHRRLDGLIANPLFVNGPGTNR